MREYAQALSPALISVFGALVSITAVLYATTTGKEWVVLTLLVLTSASFVAMLVTVVYGLKQAKQKDKDDEALI